MKDFNSKKYIAMFSIHSDPLVCLGSQQAGGQNLYVKSLAEALDRLGWQVDVFTRWDDPHKKQIVQLAKKSRVIRLRNGHAKYLAKEELINLLPEIYNDFLKFINFKNKYSLFHGHYWDGGWIGLKAHLQFRKPLVANFHSLGVIRTETKKKYLKNKNDYEYFAKRLNIENEIIKESSKIISLAESEKQDLNQFYKCPPEKSIVIPGGVNLRMWIQIEKDKAREKLNLEKESFIILYVGRLEWRKGIGTLIKAGSFLKEKIPNLKILIVGGKIFGSRKNPDDFNEYQRLMKMVKQEKLENIVKFTGRIANSRLPLFYSASDVLTIPSYYEPFGLVALEGMASKIPVVASRVGGLMNIIEDNKTGFLFEPRNPLELGGKILSVYNSKQSTEQMIENGYQETKKYSWDLIARKISGIYKQLIEKNNENSSISAV